MDNLVRPRPAPPHSPPIKQARSLSPRSVMEFPEAESRDSQELPHLQQPLPDQPDYDDFFRQDNSTVSRRPNKRRLLSTNLPPRAVVNLRHRQVSDETMKWLASYGNNLPSPDAHPVSDIEDNDDSFVPMPCVALDTREEDMSSYDVRRPIEELWLGPVFESSQTVLTSIASLPDSVTHLDLDLRNALHLIPQAMPLLFRKSHLKTLSLRVFGDVGVIEMSKWMNQNPNLQHLDLRGNRIGSMGARTIVDAIKARDQDDLKDLNLSCNCILHGDLIGELLASNPTLEVLDLGYNWLGNKEVKDIFAGLSRNTRLRELNLYGCHRISHSGMKVILECLQKHNTSLHKIGLQAFDEEGERLIAEINHLLKLNKAGRYLIKSSLESPSQQRAAVPMGLWSHVLQKSNTDADSMFHLLREGFGTGIIKSNKRS
eukprot:CAMPEP_0116156166 /NCGR_PEP_ID=MMETSP0329-20121206/22690_1 /TAXON_ID=697910 /ORGANISM="Pseudo-nitzschia arenysensis, Strain B593" /LENGTH=428 /DNA_ID=CAMNT_0003653237 /DNA_START=133 /DNA_END=1419 /DNA_ORIENTATION=-